MTHENFIRRVAFAMWTGNWRFVRSVDEEARKEAQEYLEEIGLSYIPEDLTKRNK